MITRNPRWFWLLTSPLLALLIPVAAAWASPDAVLHVQPGSFWKITNPSAKGSPHITRFSNVTTPNGPGIQTHYFPGTGLASNTAHADRTFYLPVQSSHDAAFMFFYQNDEDLQDCDADSFVVFTLLDGARPVGRFDTTGLPRGMTNVVPLEPLFGVVTFNRVQISMVFTNMADPVTTVTFSDVQILPISSVRHWDLGQAVVTAPLNSTISKIESDRNTPTGGHYDTGGSCGCPAEEAEFMPDGEDTGDPVDLATGEVSIRRVDLKVPGRGLDWEFSRRYRSRINFMGPLGANWEPNYHIRLILDPTTGNFIRLDGNARSDVYVRNKKTGLYVTPAGFHTALKVLQGNPLNPSAGPLVVEILNPHGVRTRFASPAGNGLVLPISRLTDRHGNTMQFLYEDSGNPLNLTKVLDVYGRPYTYTYDAQGRIHIVQDFTGRRIILDYDAHDDLTDATGPAVTGTPNGNDFPNGKTEHYAYSSGRSDGRLNHNMLTITAPNEVAAGGPPRVQFTYQETPGAFDFDRVLTQTLGGTNASGIAAGGTISYQYTAPVLKGLPKIPAKTAVTDRDTNLTEYFFDTVGHPIIVREHTRNLRPADPAFFETDYAYRRGDGEMGRVLYPEGNETRYFYAKSKDPLQQGNLVGELRRPGPRAADQVFLMKTTAYEPIYNHVRSRTEERAFGFGFLPQNGGAPSVARYTTTTTTFDYQEGDNIANLSAATGRSQDEITALLAAAQIPTGLPDQNGDGVTASPDNVGGEVVRMDYPTVNLLPGCPQALAEGRTTQAVVATSIWNRFGQKLFDTDPEENVTRFLEWHEDKGIMNRWPGADAGVRQVLAR